MSPSFRRLLPYVFRYRRQFLLGLVCVVITTAIQLLSPWILKHAIDDLTAGVTRQKLALYAGLLLGIACVGGTFRFLMRRILIGASRDIEYDMRVASLKPHLVYCPEYLTDVRDHEIARHSRVRWFNDPWMLGEAIRALELVLSHARRGGMSIADPEMRDLLDDASFGLLTSMAGGADDRIAGLTLAVQARLSLETRLGIVAGSAVRHIRGLA